VPEVNQTSRGRPPSTSRDAVSQYALQLFAARGFDETTLDEIAAGLGVGRRTLFRYFDSKNDMVWGDFETVLGRLHEELMARSADVPLMDALRAAVIASNTYPNEAQDDLRIRMTLITTVPALQAHSMLRYEDWRNVVAEFAAGRLGASAQDLVPRSLGYAALAASTAAFTHWVEHPGEDLLKLLDRTYGLMAAGFDPARFGR
jgi:TetR/AcrR family transcriptional regulator, regulator of mycofactocin system